MSSRAPKRVKIGSAPSEPKGWKAIFEGIREYRAANYAPVDDMGCTQLADSTDEKVFRYQTLVALQLSSQTKDQVTSEAMGKLKAHQPGGLTPQSIVQMDETVLDGYISKVGFHNRKTMHLQQTARILLDEYDGDIPPTVEKLMALPGVGPKMAYLAMQCAWRSNVGIGVDTHVHRISNRLGWSQTAKPEDTRVALEGWLPREHWSEINHMLVGFGQTLCKPIGPLCSECPVKDLCPKIGIRKSISRK